MVWKRVMRCMPENSILLHYTKNMAYTLQAVVHKAPAAHSLNGVIAKR